MRLHARAIVFAELESKHPRSGSCKVLVHTDACGVMAFRRPARSWDTAEYNIFLQKSSGLGVLSIDMSSSVPTNFAIRVISQLFSS